MASLVRVVSLLCALIAQRVPEAASTSPDVCDVCICSSTNPSSANVDTASCEVRAIRPQDTDFLSPQHPTPVILRSLSLTCNGDRFKYHSVVSSETLGALEDLEELHLQNCDLSYGLTSSSFQHMKRLKKLSIVDCILPQVTEKMTSPSYLSSLSNLERLSMTGCKLSRLPSLPKWRQLRHLNVSHNNLHSLDFLEHTPEDDTLNTRPRMKNETGHTSESDIESGLAVLDASYNPMTSLPMSAIAASRRLEKLILRGVPITEFRLPNDLELPELVVLDAPDTSIGVFEFPRLCSSVRLEELSLRGQGVPVEIGDLSCLTNLTRLTLVKLGLNSTLWKQLRSSSLIKLFLSDNVITSVDTSRCPKLQTLVLDNNRISSINASSSFTNLPELQLLNISLNAITELPSNCFLGTPNLKALDASNNKLTNIRSSVLSGMTQLFYLNLAHNDISSMGFTLFRNTPSIKYLYLQHNKIGFLPRLNTMHGLSLFNVSYNQIRSIEPRHLEGLTSLKVLLANNNALQQVRDNLFSNTPSLMEAWLNDNKIQYVGNLGQHRNLQILRLENNLISDFLTGSPFSGLQALAFLSLDHNYITVIRRFAFPPSLRFLYLGSNYIRWMEPDSFANLPQLQLVDIESNKMVFTLPMTAVNGFKLNYPKPIFYIGGNQFFCDCNMAYLKLLFERPKAYDMFVMYYPTFHGLEQTLCEVSYEGKHNRLFKDVPLSDFACQYPEPYCSSACDCCNLSLTQRDPVPTSCDCQLTCPVGCSCYVAGASLLRDYYHIRCDSRNFSQVPDRIPPMAVNLFLDGNHISNVSNIDFYRLGQLENLYLNFSALENLGDSSFRNCTVLEFLYLDHNLLQSLHNDTFLGLSSLTHLYLHHNTIEVISPGALDKLVSLKILTLHNNRLVKVGSYLDNFPRSLEQLTLSQNPWSCDCEDSKELYDMIHVRSKTVVDKDSMCCYFSQDDQLTSMAVLPKPSETVSTLSSRVQPDFEANSLADRGASTDNKLLTGASAGEHNSSDPMCQPLWTSDFSVLCGNNNQTSHNLDRWRQQSSPSGLPVVIVVLITLAVLLSLAACFVIFAIFKRRELQALAYVKLGIRVFDKKAQVDKEDKGTKAFDAFISYSSKDDEFVAGTLVPALEDPRRGYRVCVHYRDFPVGGTITDTICRAIECSSRTILLLSQNFLKSEWCRFEFQTAHRHILREGSHRLVIVLYGELPDDMLDPDLEVHLKSRSFLRFEDPWFWEKLYFSLPDVKKRKENQDKENIGDDPRDEVDHNDVEIQAKTAIRAMRILTGKHVDDGRANVDVDV
ncbi:Toll-like receptor Tollo [Elysia marginata]|uniref:Toll-like receptor Tollo n=1 Tax=Elysia marginata TaxID=1093978 RepID=A0AAV4I9J8_9GAST|nr:Toll-like receptor Tollo [Elysia marginata]